MTTAPLSPARRRLQMADRTDWVLVVGATGRVGAEVCRRLRARGEAVRALVRSTSDRGTRAGLEALGVRLYEGDIEHPETLGPAFDGASAVVSTASAFPRDPRADCIERVDHQGQIAVVDAAERGGAERMVFISFPEASRDHPFQRAKRAVEERLRAASLDHVILHPEKFMDVWFTPPLGFEPEGRVRLYDGGVAVQAWVAADDVAEVAVQSVRLPAARNQTVQFGGPQPLSQLDVVAVYERLLDRKIETENMPRSEIEAMLDGAPTPTVESLAGVLLEATEPSGAEWPGFEDTFQLRRTSVADFAAAHTTT
jgi:NADH dehydrogenase